MTPTYVTLVRHGESVWNVIHRWQGQAPIPLTENGKKQAQRAAEYLVGVDRIYSSPNPRAYQTAQIIAAKIGLSIHLENDLQEIDVGDWQGLLREEIQAWDGERFSTQLDGKSFLERSFPGGESGKQLVERTKTIVQQIADRHPGEHILCASHGGSIRSAVYGLTGEYVEQPVMNCSITRISYHENVWKLLEFAVDAAGARF